MGLLTFQRYRLRKAQELAERGERALAGVFKTKHLEDPGADVLPENFINAKVYGLLTTAEPVPYTTYQALNGASVDELVKISGIGEVTAQKILDAVDAFFEA